MSISSNTVQSYVSYFRYIFFADKVEINDITEKTCMFSLVGRQSFQVRKYIIVIALFIDLIMILIDSLHLCAQGDGSSET